MTNIKQTLLLIICALGLTSMAAQAGTDHVAHEKAFLTSGELFELQLERFADVGGSVSYGSYYDASTGDTYACVRKWYPQFGVYWYFGFLAFEENRTYVFFSLGSGDSFGSY